MKKIGSGNYDKVWLLKQKDLKKRIRNEINTKKRKQTIRRRRDIKRNLNIKKFRPSKNSKNNRFFFNTKIILHNNRILS